MFRVIIAVFVMFFGNIASANFGYQCSSLSGSYFSTTQSTDLQQNSILGFLVNLIDIQNCGATYTNGNGCNDPSISTMTVCIKNSTSDTSRIATSTNSQATIISVTNPPSPVPLGSLTTNPDIVNNPTLASINITVGVVGGNLCMTMPSVYGNAPIMCRSLPVQSNSAAGLAALDMSSCSQVSQACDLLGYANNPSMSHYNFFGSAIQCVYESLNTIFLNPATCNQTTITNFSTSNEQTTVTPFAEFYSAMSLTVVSALALYLMFFGIKMSLNPGEMTVNEIFIAIIKVIAVMYFSVGLTSLDWFSGKTTNSNGITAIVLPLLISFTNSMSTYIFENAASNGLCYFPTGAPSTYPAEYTYYALWDSLDCRLNAYLGNVKLFWLNSGGPPGQSVYSLSGYTSPVAQNMPIAFSSFSTSPVPMLTQVSDTAENITNASEGVAFIVASMAFLLGGGILIFIVLLIVMLTIIGLVYSIFMSFLVSIVLLYIFGYVAPIFVPMSLFERTKGYFTAWMNLCLASAVQPILIMGFGAFIICLIDSFMFDSCGFDQYINPDGSGRMKYVYQLMIPGSGNSVLNPSMSAKDACTGSMGYKLLQFFESSAGWENNSYLFFSIIQLSDVWNLQGSMWTGLVMCFFMKYLLDQVYALTADLSGGVGLDSVVMKPTAALDAAKAALNLLTKGAKKLQSAKKGGGGKGGGKRPPIKGKG